MILGFLYCRSSASKRRNFLNLLAKSEKYHMDDVQKEVHLLDYLNLLRKNKWLIIACLFITVTTVIIGNYTLTPVYQAQSQMIIDKERSKSIVTGRELEYLDYESYLSEELTFNTQFKTITSYPVLERAVKNLQFKERYEKQKNQAIESLSPFKIALRENIKKFKETIQNFFPSFNQSVDEQADTFDLSSEQKMNSEMIALVSSLKEKITTEQVPDTRFINISVMDEDPVWAQKIANGLVEAYIEYDITSRFNAANKFMDWISLQINEMKNKLAESERGFYKFKNDNKIFSIKGKQDINTQKIGEVSASYLKVRTQRMEMKARIAELEKIMSRRNKKYSGADLLNDPILVELGKELTDTQIELKALKTKYKNKHPKSLNLSNRIEVLRAEFDNKLRKAYNSMLTEDSILQSKGDTLLQAIKDYEKDALLTNKKELQYAVLEREVETNKSLYEIMLNKLKETQINESMGKSYIRLIEPAALPKFPIKPKKKLNIILGIILGLMSGIGLSFLLEYLETSIKTEEDVQQYLQLPVLGIVPEVEKG